MAAGGIGLVGIDLKYTVTDASGFRTKATRMLTLGVIGNTAAWTCVAFGAWTAATWWRLRRRRRRGMCEHCGYDLRGLAGSAVEYKVGATCPECGGATPATLR